jgi:hypothetical protein
MPNSSPDGRSNRLTFASLNRPHRPSHQQPCRPILLEHTGNQRDETAREHSDEHPVASGHPRKGYSTHTADYMPLVGDDAIKGQSETRGARDKCSRDQICHRFPRFNLG